MVESRAAGLRPVFFFLVELEARVFARGIFFLGGKSEAKTRNTRAERKEKKKNNASFNIFPLENIPDSQLCHPRLSALTPTRTPLHSQCGFPLLRHGHHSLDAVPWHVHLTELQWINTTVSQDFPFKRCNLLVVAIETTTPR